MQCVKILPKNPKELNSAISINGYHSRHGGAMVTILASSENGNHRFPAAAGRPVTRLYLAQLLLEMHTPWLVGLTLLQLVK